VAQEARKLKNRVASRLLAASLDQTKASAVSSSSRIDYTLSELDEKLRQMCLLMDTEAAGCTYEGAEVLARYGGHVPGTNAFNAFGAEGDGGVISGENRRSTPRHSRRVVDTLCTI
jgi:hypothetical protein